jgi:diguanylate cyclase (GGDEF)-like protein/PAS domain S-box-containing protein
MTMPQRRDPSSASRPALHTAALYALVAGGWILTSDWLLALFGVLPQTVLLLQTLKGLGFVAVTSILLFVLFRAQLRRREESERRFSTLVENLPGMVYRCENDGHWTMRYVSRAAQRLTGYAPVELIGNARIAYAELIHPDDREHVWKEVQQAIRADRSFQLEYRLSRQDGNLIWVWEQGCAVRDKNHERDIVLEGLMLDVTERKQAEAIAREAAERLESVGDNLPGGAIYRLYRNPNGDYRFTYASRGVEQLLGISRERMLADAASVFSLTEPPYDRHVSASNERSACDLSIVDMELPQRLPDGTRKWIAVRSLPYRSAEGGVLWDGIVLDISERKAAEEKLREAAAVFANTAEGVVITTLDGEIRDVNQAFVEVTGYEREEAIGENPRILRSGRHDCGFYQAMWQSLRETGQWHGEIWNRRKDGMIYPELLTISVVRDGQGEATGYVGVFTDITPIKEAEERLEYLAQHDALTGLPNRLLFNTRLRHSMRKAQRGNGKLAILFFDLDRFKHINDSLGHTAGDQLLQQFAQRLTDSLRAGDTVARISGDEFIVLLEEVDSSATIAAITLKLIEALKPPVIIDGSQVGATASIGISLYPDDGDTEAMLLRNADAAMYRAKEEGGNTYQFYTAEMTAAAFEQVFLDNALRDALGNQEFRLVYQPLVDLSSRRLLGVEALLRWEHPQQGTIAPARFIHIAEQNGLIREIGRWVLRSACEQGARWRNKGFEFGVIAVNIAGRQIHDRAFVADVERILADTGLPPDCLELEVSEGYVMRRADLGVGRLNALRLQGVGIAIDDFGTGYSSLSRLKRLPITKLKIDQGFVRDIPNDPNDMALCDAVIAISRSLDLAVIAEGVETEAQAAFLLEKGCGAAQGYLFSRPVAPDEIERLFAVNRPASESI